MLCYIADDIKASALSGRYAACAVDTRGAATLCPGLCACCPFRAHGMSFSSDSRYLKPAPSAPFQCNDKPCEQEKAHAQADVDRHHGGKECRLRLC